MGLPGLYKECQGFLSQFGISDLKLYSKPQFKKIVKEKIHYLNKVKVLEMIGQKGYKKVDFNAMKKDNFELKSYLKELKVADARLKFKLVSSMTPTVKMNFQSDRVFTKNLWTCSGCLKYRDTQKHILHCDAYKSMRINRDLSKDTDLVSYFRDVINHRISVE